MSQYGSNLEIRPAGSSLCVDVMGRARANYGVLNVHTCKYGTNQRWILKKTTFNADGVVCRSSPSHPERDCSGLNDKQAKIYLGKTLTRARCEELCKGTGLSTCRWE